MFARSAAVFICLLAASERLCALSPLFLQRNKKAPARRVGAGCQKAGEKKCGGRKRGNGKKKGKKRSPGSPEIYLFRLPASLKLPVGDFKMAPPLPATDWTLPCQNVFEWKIQTEKSPPPLPASPLLSFLLFSLTLAPSFSLPPPLPASVHPSSHTERASHSLQ